MASPNPRMSTNSLFGKKDDTEDCLRNWSHELQIRLQYARLKVDHGWTRQTLSEVENLYFHHYPPRSLQNRSQVNSVLSDSCLNAAPKPTADPTGPVFTGPPHALASVGVHPREFSSAYPKSSNAIQVEETDARAKLSCSASICPKGAAMSSTLPSPAPRSYDRISPDSMVNLVTSDSPHHVVRPSGHIERLAQADIPPANPSLTYDAFWTSMTDSCLNRT